MSDSVVISSNALSLANDFGAAGFKIGVAAGALVRHYGVRLLASVKAHAAGRPGPRMITGDLNRSLALDVSGGLGGATKAFVGTNRPQAARLEFGFHGTDSLGRRYNQPPYPYFGPAFDEISPLFERAADDLVDGVLD